MPSKSFQRVYERFEPSIRASCNRLLFPEAKALTDQFYQELMQDDEARVYLDNDLVRNRLTDSFIRWAKQVFDTSASENSDELDQLHLQIGLVHARVGVPMHLISFGMQAVRDHALDVLLREIPSAGLPNAVAYVNSLLDTCLAIMNRSFLDRAVVDERNAQLMRFKMAHSYVALECERMRSELISWSRDLALTSGIDKIDFSSKENSVYATAFGLWIAHKAELYFPDYPELAKIRAILVQIDALLKNWEAWAKDDDERHATNHMKIREHVDEIGWFINQIIEKSQQEYESKDTLTRLINRRFIDNVMRKEVEASRARDENFATLMIDIDNFKSVNDLHGHAFGDTVLQEVSSVILQSVRVTDFCFRYGGEEILVVIPNTKPEAAARRAEVLRQAVEGREFVTESGAPVAVTISIGVAMYEGHPDYQRVIEVADQNLYTAKKQGKNRIVM